MMPYSPWMQARGQSMGALAPQMKAYETNNLWSQGNQSENPFRITAGNTGMGGWNNSVDRENVMASQGAGAAPGADWTSRLGQQMGMDQQAMQRQQDLARAAYMRATPTPGGMQAYGDQQAQRWQQMMQGLQGMRPQRPRGNRF